MYACAFVRVSVCTCRCLCVYEFMYMYIWHWHPTLWTMNMLKNNHVPKDGKSNNSCMAAHACPNHAFTAESGQTATPDLRTHQKTIYNWEWILVCSLGCGFLLLCEHCCLIPVLPGFFPKPQHHTTSISQTSPPLSTVAGRCLGSNKYTSSDPCAHYFEHETKTSSVVQWFNAFNARCCVHKLSTTMGPPLNIIESDVMPCLEIRDELLPSLIQELVGRSAWSQRLQVPGGHQVLPRRHRLRLHQLQRNVETLVCIPLTDRGWRSLTTFHRSRSFIDAYYAKRHKPSQSSKK